MIQVNRNVCDNILRFDDLADIELNSLTKKTGRVARVVFIGIIAGTFAMANQLVKLSMEKLGVRATVPALLLIVPISAVFGSIYGAFAGGKLVKDVMLESGEGYLNFCRFHLQKKLFDRSLLINILRSRIPENFFDEVGTFFRPLNIFSGDMFRDECLVSEGTRFVNPKSQAFNFVYTNYLNDENKRFLCRYLFLLVLHINKIKSQSEKIKIIEKMKSSLLENSEDKLLKEKVKRFLELMLNENLAGFPAKLKEKIRNIPSYIDTRDHGGQSEQLTPETLKRMEMSVRDDKPLTEQVAEELIFRLFNEAIHEFWKDLGTSINGNPR